MYRKDIVFLIDMERIYYLYTQAMGWKIGRSVVKTEQTENEAYDCEARI